MSNVLKTSHLPTEQESVIRAAESMKLFERDGMIAYGKWREWWRAAPEEAARLLAEFKGQKDNIGV